MWRTELIPQTKAAINQGTVYYHFSIKRSTTNIPSATNEHQICFFESHFTELKYGWVNGEQGTSNTNLQWMVGGQSKWKVELVADVWHNVAYEIVRFYNPTFLVLIFGCMLTMICRTSPPTKSPSGIPQAPTLSQRPPAHSLAARHRMVPTGILVSFVCLARVTMVRVLRIGTSAACTLRAVL